MSSRLVSSDGRLCGATLGLIVCLLAPRSGLASPVFSGLDGSHDYDLDECDDPTGSADICTYTGAANLWECEVALALTTSERTSGYTIESSWVHMIKDPDSDVCDNDTYGAGTYCAFGEVIVDDGSGGNETRYFYCSLANVELEDARLIGDEDGEDNLLFHFDQDSTEYDLKPDDDGNSLTTQLRGLGGDDELHGSRYADSGDKYLDKVYGADGDDVIWGHLDDDELYGNYGQDDIFGGCGEDTIDGGPHADLIHAGGGDDTSVNGGGGDDVIMGDDGQDTLSGDADDDIICGGAVNGDVLAGGAGDDTLWDTDAGTLHGGTGTDACGDTSPTRIACEGSTLTAEPSACAEDPEIAITCP